MTHTEYNELTGLLKKIAGDADTLRAVFDKVEVSIDDPSDRRRIDGITKKKVASDQARQHARFKMRYIDLQRTENDVKRAVDVMNKCVDGWSESNQARADQAKTVTADDRALYEAMSSFISATDNPVEGVSGVYAPLRSRCRSWMDQATSWFAELYPSYIRNILKDTSYKEKVGDGKIIQPFTWTGTIKELTSWIDDNCFVSDPVAFQVTGHENQWSLIDCLFKKKDGKPITAKQLKDAFKH